MQVHGSLARAGKVRGQTPKVAKQTDKPKRVRGRAKRRLQYNRRFKNIVVGAGGKKKVCAVVLTLSCVCIVCIDAASQGPNTQAIK
jgi:small subunit ribosomal protein S30e